MRPFPVMPVQHGESRSRRGWRARSEKVVRTFRLPATRSVSGNPTFFSSAAKARKADSPLVSGARCRMTLAASFAFAMDG